MSKTVFECDCEYCGVSLTMNEALEGDDATFFCSEECMSEYAEDSGRDQESYVEDDHYIEEVCAAEYRDELLADY